MIYQNNQCKEKNLIQSFHSDLGKNNEVVKPLFLKKIRNGLLIAGNITRSAGKCQGKVLGIKAENKNRSGFWN